MKKNKKNNNWLEISKWIMNNFSIPMFFVLLFSLASIINYNRIFTNVCAALAITIILLCIIIPGIVFKKYTFKPCRRFLIISLIAITISLYLSLIHYFTESTLYYAIGIIIFELYAISYIIINTITRSTPFINTISMCFQFIFFGYIAIFISTYNFDGNTLFNSLITLFSAVVGGSLTLGGVAWTIKHQKDQKLEEDKEKARPYFKFIEFIPDKEKLAGQCTVQTKNTDFIFSINTFIKNSNLSLFKLKKLYHDGLWINLTTHTIVLPDEIVCLKFQIKNPKQNVYLEIEDSMKIRHYYKLITEEYGNSCDITDYEEVNEKNIHFENYTEANNFFY